MQIFLFLQGRGADRKFAFEATAWQACVGESIQLTRVFRQADEGFQRVLAAIRGGYAPSEVVRKLRDSCHREMDTSDGILPTKVLKSILCVWNI